MINQTSDNPDNKYSAVHLKGSGILTGRAVLVQWEDPTAVPQEMKTNVR